MTYIFPKESTAGCENIPRVRVRVRVRVRIE
jgi:hypothetical protein